VKDGKNFFLPVRRNASSSVVEVIAMILHIQRLFLKIVILPCIALVAASTLVAAQSLEDADAIENTIRSQITAMQADDWDEAFTYASPTIQGIFQTPGSFSQMVTNGYPMVWRPQSYSTGSLTQTPDGLVQTMFFIDQKGRVFIADYTMQMIDGVWLINGVHIRPAEGQSA
jgi:hypothetical protein